MRISFTICLFLFTIVSFSQRWAIRPELGLTISKAKYVANTNPYPPFMANYSNNIAANFNIDYYLRNSRNRITLLVGTYDNSFTMTNNDVYRKGPFRFFSPDLFLSEGTSLTVLTCVSYGKNLAKNPSKNSVFLLGGFQYFILQSVGIGGAGGNFGSFILYDTDMHRETNGNLGWHAGLNALIKNKKQREVLQVSFKYLGTFNTTQFTNDYYYSMITPTNPPEILNDQVIRYRLTGAGIQIGVSKSLKYFPGQRKIKKK
jgi:hypothetical protein